MCKKTKDSLCWNCKRALDTFEYNCSWSSNFQPVKEWKAEPGGYYDIPSEEEPEKIIRTQGWCVIECPLYIQAHEYASYTDAMRAITSYLSVSPQSFYNNPERYIKRYEEQSGKTIPSWVKKWKEILESDMEAGE